MLYAWAEKSGVKLLNSGDHDDAWLTSMAFSSTQGCKCILAFGRSNSKLALMSIYDSSNPEREPGVMPRFEVRQPAAVSCLSWRPTYTMRPSRSPFNYHSRTLVKTEDLLVGDEAGHVWYYAVEWPDRWEFNRNTWRGEMVLLAVIKVHTQQICGLSWSTSGEIFASGGNDNLCCLFDRSKILERWDRAVQRLGNTSAEEDVSPQGRTPHLPPAPAAIELKPGDERYKWTHGAAVKAIAFCPWQDGLVATGGGSNDKCIHFFHTTSGAALATISASAQVTSLIWSTARREIVATFGYAQPEHPYRIAVFSWPDCHQVAAIP
jgi:WD40 repeat protein